MCIKLVAKAFECETDPYSKLVLLSLAERANPKHGDTCWNSINDIKIRTGLSARCIQGRLKRLESSGHLTRKFRADDTTIYHIHPRTRCARARDAGVHKVRARPARETKNSRTLCGVTENNQKRTLIIPRSTAEAMPFGDIVRSIIGRMPASDEPFKFAADAHLKWVRSTAEASREQLLKKGETED